MLTKLACSSTLMLALTLSACAPTGSLTGAASKDVADALAIGCPILATVQALGPSMNAKQKAAARALALVCPPNQPPTSAMIAGRDLLAAYATLQPLLK